MNRRLEEFLQRYLHELYQQSDGDDDDYEHDDDYVDIDDDDDQEGDDNTEEEGEEDESAAAAYHQHHQRYHTRQHRAHQRSTAAADMERAFRDALQQRRQQLQKHEITQIITTARGSSRGSSDRSDAVQQQSQQEQEQAESVAADGRKWKRRNRRPIFSDDNVFSLLRRRERNEFACNSRPQMAHIATRYMPNTAQSTMDAHDEYVFCGQFSQDGSIFVSACQDQNIRLYDIDNILFSMSRRTRATPFKTIQARDVGWTVVDVHFSTDQKSIIYSSWSPYVHLATTDMDERSRHEALDLSPNTMRFCPFSIRFSPGGGREILAGASDAAIYLYDIEYKRRTVRIPDAHGSDINTVTFASDHDAHVFYSGSDDGLIKVWDRRSVGNGDGAAAAAVGVLVGHTHGITHISSKGDGVYFASNGKDQCMKLWDIRRMKTPGDPTAPTNTTTVSHSSGARGGGGGGADSNGWDYRYQHCPRRYARRIHPDDMSLMTYAGGHRVLQTLIRCYFSPVETTGQSYLYTGSQDGSVYIYDILTGEVVQKLTGHSALVRDVSWHPRQPLLMSTSWDSSVRCWTYNGRPSSRRAGDEDYSDEEEDGHHSDGRRSNVHRFFVSDGDDEDPESGDEVMVEQVGDVERFYVRLDDENEDDGAHNIDP